MWSMGYTEKQANVSNCSIHTVRATTSSAVSEVQTVVTHLLCLLNQGITKLSRKVIRCTHVNTDSLRVGILCQYKLLQLAVNTCPWILHQSSVTNQIITSTMKPQRECEAS